MFETVESIRTPLLLVVPVIVISAIVNGASAEAPLAAITRPNPAPASRIVWPTPAPCTVTDLSMVNASLNVPAHACTVSPASESASG